MVPSRGHGFSSLCFYIRPFRGSEKCIIGLVAEIDGTGRMDAGSAIVKVRSVQVEEVRPIRATILRPNQCAEACIYPMDDDADSGHFGAYIEGELIGIASIYHDAPPGESGATAWRLRGMATLQRARRHGVGSRLLEASMGYIAARGGTYLWCNARTTAAEFYLSHGFEKIGAEFELPDIGPHWFMSRHIATG